MSNNKVLLQKYYSQIKNKKNDVKNLKKEIRRSRFNNCKTHNDFKIRKLSFQLELDNVKEDILKAGSKYDPALVYALKNKEGRIKIKLNEVNDILVLFDKINRLNDEIINLENKIKKLGGIKHMDEERKQMNIVLKALRKNYSREDAARLANVDLKRIVNWIHEGKNKTNKNKIYFFRQYSRINSNKKCKIDKY